MRRRNIKLLTVAFIIMLLVFSSIGHAYAATFSMIDIGKNPYKNEYNYSIMFMCGAAPGDGSVLLGDYFGNVVKWTPSGGLQAVGHNPYDPLGNGRINAAFYTAVAVGDGSVLFGDAQGHIVRWTPENGLQGVGTNPYGHALRSSAVSSDGTILFGDERGNVIRLTPTGIEQIGSNPYGSDSNNIMRVAVAAKDGSVLFGDGYGHVIRWTASEGLKGIGTDPYGNYMLFSGAALKDGSVVFGDSFGYVIKWTPSNILEPVGLNPYAGATIPRALFSAANIGNDIILFGDDSDNIISWDADNGLQMVGTGPYGFWNAFNAAVAVGDGSVIFTTNGLGEVLRVVSSVTLTTLEVQPDSLNLGVGKTQKLTVNAAYSDGSVVDVTSSSSCRPADSTIVKVENGMVTGLKEGSTVIIVQYGGMSYTVPVTVSNSILTNIEVSPNPIVISKGQSQPLTVVAKYQDGSVKDVTAQASYQAEDNTIVVVSGNQATGVKSGTTNIVVAYEGISISVPVTVNASDLLNIVVNPTLLNLAIGESQQLTVTAYFSDGSTKNVTAEATYQSGDSVVVNVNSTGKVIGLNQGNTYISVSYQGQSASVPVNVNEGQPELVGLTVTPNSLYLAKGQTQQLSVVALFSNGATQNVTSLASYQSGNESVATVSSEGLVTGIEYGSTQITVSYENKSVVIPVTIGRYTVISLGRQVYQEPTTVQPTRKEKITPTVSSVTKQSSGSTTPTVSLPTKKESVSPTVNSQTTNRTTINPTVISMKTQS